MQRNDLAVAVVSHRIEGPLHENDILREPAGRHMQRHGPFRAEIRRDPDAHPRPLDHGRTPLRLRGERDFERFGSRSDRQILGGIESRQFESSGSHEGRSLRNRNHLRKLRRIEIDRGIALCEIRVRCDVQPDPMFPGSARGGFGRQPLPRYRRRHLRSPGSVGLQFDPFVPALVRQHDTPGRNLQQRRPILRSRAGAAPEQRDAPQQP